MRVTSAEFLRRFGVLTDRALVEPVIITRRGTERLVVMSVDSYRALATQATSSTAAPARPKRKERSSR